MYAIHVTYVMHLAVCVQPDKNFQAPAAFLGGNGVQDLQKCEFKHVKACVGCEWA